MTRSWKGENPRPQRAPAPQTSVYRRASMPLGAPASRRQTTVYRRGPLAVYLTLVLAFPLALGRGRLSAQTEDPAPPADRPSEASARPPLELDPAAWGSDHIGRSVPEYTTGDECLFCHRNDIGRGWRSSRHALSLRRARADSPAVVALRKSPVLRAVADEPELYLLGSRRMVRFLKPGGYGRLSLLEEAWVPSRDPPLNDGEVAGRQESPRGGLTRTDKPHWNERTFAEACAGCHTTGVGVAGTFSDASLDCYVCHGEGKLDHSNDPRQILLAKDRADPARVVISICAQCHVRTGTSRSTKRPYPDNFVPGDNLWRDLEVDFSDRALAALSPSDRHILANVRDVISENETRITCLACHEVHAGSSRRHRRFRRRDICWHCHDRNNLEEIRRPLESHNPRCEY